jgi:hypothetical protein
MSQVMDHGATTGDPRPPTPDTGSGRRLVLAMIVLGLLLGAVAGWSAFAVLSAPSAEERSLDAQRERWEGIAEEETERAGTGRAAADARFDIERQPWEGPTDRFVPGSTEAR